MWEVYSVHCTVGYHNITVQYNHELIQYFRQQHLSVGVLLDTIIFKV